MKERVNSQIFSLGLVQSTHNGRATHFFTTYTRHAIRVSMAVSRSTGKRDSFKLPLASLDIFEASKYFLTELLI
jgi:hypothetical protein